MKFPLPRRPKFNKTWAVLGVSLVIGVLAALGARSFLAQQMSEIEARSRGKTVNVVVAKQALKRGDALSGETVAVRAVPLDYAHSSAISPGDFDRVDGQRLAYDVGPGEMILWGLLETKRVPTFSARVETGRRAMTVPVDEISSISGMLEPGDVIDLIVTVDRDGRKLTFPLLQTVKVMATGQRSVDDPKGGAVRQYATVTLDTTPEEAQRVIVAREAGRITALLRNPQDGKATASVQGDIDALLGLKKKGPNGEAWQVPVIYGGQGGKFSPEALNLGLERGGGASDELAIKRRIDAAMRKSAAAEDATGRVPLASAPAPLQP